MHDLDELVNRIRLAPDKAVRLKQHDPGWCGDKDVPEKERRAFAERVLTDSVQELADAQELLYASDRWSLLVIFQGMDASGKDGLVKHVMSGVNPLGVKVTSFKQPTAEELDHTFLWRCTKALPARGEIGIFNRSYYEEVLIVRVHPELIAHQRLPEAEPDRKKFWKSRFDDINRFEKHLARNGTRILKFFLNISKDEQRRRFLERIDNPKKQWKFAAGDVRERGFWNDYQAAYKEALSETSTKAAPWYVVPADHKWVARATVAHILATEIVSLDMQFPTLSPDQRAELEAYKRQLLAEEDD